VSGFNLPPGVTVNMLPGNRPEDEAYDTAFEWAVDEIEYEFEYLVNRIVDDAENEYEVELDHHDLIAEWLSMRGYVKRRKEQKNA
jgi:hypothetical protein